MAYGRGFGAVQEAIEKANAAGDFTPFILTHPIQALWNMTWEDGETKTVRFLTDNVVTIPFHNFIATREGKRAEFVDTSELSGPLQRPDWIAANLKDEKGKPLRPTRQTIAIVVERVLNPDTKEYEDVTDIFQTPSDPEDPNSEKVDVEWPRFWVIKQGMRFWGQVNAWWSDEELGGTTTNRNYKITRSGKTAQNTSYNVKPVMKGDDMTAADLAALYAIPPVDTEGYDADTAAMIDEDPVFGHIIKWIERRGTEKWFEKLTGTAEIKKEKPALQRGLGVSRPAPKASDSSEAAPSSNLADRLRGTYSIK